MKRAISAGAVIFRKDRGEVLYLLLHYTSGHWEYVKGTIEEGESVKETILREAREEAGLEDLEFIESFKDSMKYIFSWPPKDKLKRGEVQEKVFKIVTYRLAETKTRDIKISFEHIGYEWLPYERAMERLTFKSAKEILSKANKFLKNF